MSFGFGGSNSHVILDDACNFLKLNGLSANHWSIQSPPSSHDAQSCPDTFRLVPPVRRLPQLFDHDQVVHTDPKLLVWSAADQDVLVRQLATYGSHVSQTALTLSDEEAALYLENLSYTLASRRTKLNWRSFFVARSLSDVGKVNLNLTKACRIKSAPRLGFVFTGQGAQYPGMGKDLIIYPVFKNSLRRSDICLNSVGCQWSLLGMQRSFVPCPEIYWKKYPQHSWLYLCLRNSIVMVEAMWLDINQR